MPAAAMVAFTALLLWRRQTRASAIGLAITSGLTALSKSTALGHPPHDGGREGWTRERRRYDSRAGDIKYAATLRR
jgi:hypothetical protein